MGAKQNIPRSGSMQFWPRCRAKKAVPRIHSYAKVKEPRLIGFAGFKVGMTHVMFSETKKTARFAGETVSVPTTIIECPPLRIYSVRFYTKDSYGTKVAKDILNLKFDKELSRTVILPKEKHDSVDKEDISKYSDIRVLVYTQPGVTCVGQKKPQIFEVALGGSMDEKFKFVKDNFDKEIKLSDVFKEGEYVDVTSVTTGKGVAGPMKRFGIGRKSHKSEKGTRRPGCICASWKGHAHIMYRTAQAGKMGYHTRLVRNLKIMKISDNISEIANAGGHNHYGVVRNTYLLLKGSVPGPQKRLIRINTPIRPSRLHNPQPVKLEYVSVDSKQ